MARVKLRRGEVWWIAFDPTQGSEVTKRRPAVIVSNDRSNRYLDRVQVVPLTSNTDRVYVSECLVTLKQQPGKAMADQVRTVSTDRLDGRISTLSDDEMRAVETVLRIQLDL